jgi:metal-responsive CopG/Arc/MetJ family transcriptional regulator
MSISIHIYMCIMKTIQMTIDPRLLRAVDKLTRMRKTTRSALIRGALEAELKRAHVSELEARHAAGYAAHPSPSDESDIWLDQQEWGRP